MIMLMSTSRHCTTWVMMRFASFADSPLTLLLAQIINEVPRFFVSSLPSVLVLEVVCHIWVWSNEADVRRQFDI